MSRLVAVCTAAALLGCSVTTVSVPRPVPADLQLGRLGEKTDFETAGKTDPPKTQSDRDPDKGQSARVGLFWAGIALTAVGGAGTIALAATGQATQSQLRKGYEDGSLTRAKEEQLQDRGELVNKLAIGTGALALLGIAFATIAYGIDYTRCGKLAKRRKKCREQAPAAE